MDTPEWLEDLRAGLADPLPATGWVAVAGALALPLLVALGRTEDGWMPFLDGINLLFHEAGHPLFGLFGWETLALLGGTLMQVLVPLLLAGHFRWRRHPLGFVLALQWAAQNLLNIARYLADARTQVLPLVGGGEHDWGTLLGQWHLLARDTEIAGRVAVLGWIGLLLPALWMAWRAWRRSGA